MAWDGYYEYAGTEIINVQRTETYAENARARWFRPQFKNDSLGLLLGDGDYKTPLLDDAPWTDPDVVESYDFWGVYPLGIDGVESSSRTSTVVESTGEGGVVGRVRHGTKAMVFNVLLIGGTDAAVDYGMKWLRRALLPGICTGTQGCLGDSLCYLSSEPEYERPPGSLEGTPTSAVIQGSDVGPEVYGGTAFDDVADVELSGGNASTENPSTTYGTWPFETPESTFPENWPDPAECLTEYQRSMRQVTINNGPSVTAKRQTKDGGTAWQVTFTAVAGLPYEFGPETSVLEGFLDPDIAVPWAEGEEPAGGSVDTIGQAAVDAPCDEPLFVPVVDPLHPAIIPPPPPPSVPLGNFTPPMTWWRRQVAVPKQYVPLWGEVVPYMEVHARTDDLRNLRLRFYADPYLTGDISDDPCAYCGDIIVSYVPMDHTLVFDGTEERVYVTTTGGGRQRADSLVFKSDGTPFEWPTLTCGFGYVVTFDLPKEQTPPVIDLSLYPRTV